ncbi:MAG: glycosyltransferase family 4 protein, partial [Theionarchaea archaeon]|nr:glycosyltransferase family 4 protein [Theionarchaea archaeon]
MKVCLVSYEYPPILGGEASYTHGLALSLHRSGVDVTVLTSDRGSSNRDREGIEVVRLGISNRRPFKIASFQRASAFYLSRGTGDFDVVHQTNDYFFPLPSRRPVDLVTLHHPYGAEERVVRGLLSQEEASGYLKRRSMLYLRKMQSMAARTVPRAIAVSRFTARELSREHAIPADRLDVLPNGILLEEFDGIEERDVARRSLGISSEHVLLHVGRLDHNKDIPSLLTAYTEVVGQFPDSRLLVVGSGPLGRRTEQAVASMELGDRISLMGRVDGRALMRLYAASDLVVLSSLMEGFGIVLAEAMAARRPCVTTRCGATDEVVVEGRTGLLVSPMDPNGLAGAI